MALKMIAEGEEVKLGNSTLVRERAGVYKAKDDSAKIQGVVMTTQGISLVESYDLLLKDKGGKEKNLKVEINIIFNPHTTVPEEVHTPFFNVSLPARAESFARSFTIHKDGSTWNAKFVVDLRSLRMKLEEMLNDEIVKYDLDRVMDFRRELMGCD
jgi:hypothetical protein